MTIEQLAGRIPITNASLSRIERGLQPYSQPLLEAIAYHLMCEPADLIMRKPDEDGIWSIWTNLSPETKVRAMAVLQALDDADKNDKAA